MSNSKYEVDDFKFPDEKKGETLNVQLDSDDDFDIEVNVVDDTPEEDLRHETLNRHVEDPSDDEISQYGKSIQDRIKELAHARHDERRAKEAALREAEQAAAITKKLLDENNRLKKQYMQGEQAYVQTAKSHAEMQIEHIKRKIKEAKDLGDVDAELTGQVELARASRQMEDLERYKPQEITLQDTENVVQTRQSQPETPNIDPKAKAWADRNTWFWKDKVMTGVAMGLSDELIESGYDPRSDEYYRELDSRLRKELPHKFQTSEPIEKSRPTTVVAPVTRSAPTKKRSVELTKSEQALAKRLQLTNEQYAKHKLQLEKNNG